MDVEVDDSFTYYSFLKIETNWNTFWNCSLKKRSQKIITHSIFKKKHTPGTKGKIQVWHCTEL